MQVQILHPPPHTEDRSLERDRLVIVLATIAINIAAVAVFSFIPGSNWRTAIGLNVVDNSILITHAIRRRDRLMWHLLLFGMIVGICELSTDAWLVARTGTLDYSPGGGVFIWRSPFWMPLAWEIVAVQFGYIGLRLFERFGPAGILMNGLLGAVNIPYYEELARLTHWWSYRDCAMLLHTPYYIILGEFIIAIVLALLAMQVRRMRGPRTLLAGVAGGLVTFPAYAGAFLAVGRMR